MKKNTGKDDDAGVRKKKRLPRENVIKDDETDEEGDGGWQTVKKGSSMPMVGFLNW